MAGGALGGGVGQSGGGGCGVERGVKGEDEVEGSGGWGGWVLAAGWRAWWEEEGVGGGGVEGEGAEEERVEEKGVCGRRCHDGGLGAVCFLVCIV